MSGIKDLKSLQISALSEEEKAVINRIVRKHALTINTGADVVRFLLAFYQEREEQDNGEDEP